MVTAATRGLEARHQRETLPGRRGSRGLMLASFGATVAGVIVWTWIAVFGPGDPVDAHAYYSAVGPDLYGRALGSADAYLYSPAFAQAIAPLRSLGWPAFLITWRMLEVGALLWLAGPWSLLLLAVPAFLAEVTVGNVHLLTALAISVGFRFPAAWAPILLTKVTPAVGLVWFVVRREWRQAAIALGVTATVSVVCFSLAPDDWWAWVGVLDRGGSVSGRSVLTTVPLIARLPAAALLVAWGARTDRRWTVAAAAFLAMPVIWTTSVSVLVALIPLGAFRGLRPMLERLRSRSRRNHPERAVELATPSPARLPAPDPPAP